MTQEHKIPDFCAVCKSCMCGPRPILCTLCGSTKVITLLFFYYSIFYISIIPVSIAWPFSLYSLYRNREKITFYKSMHIVSTQQWHVMENVLACVLWIIVLDISTKSLQWWLNANHFGAYCFWKVGVSWVWWSSPSNAVISYHWFHSFHCAYH